MTEELLTRKELADRLKVSMITVKRYTDSGMPVVWISSNVSRYDWQQAVKWLKKRSKSVRTKGVKGIDNTTQSE